MIVTGQRWSLEVSDGPRRPAMVLRRERWVLVACLHGQSTNLTTAMQRFDNRCMVRQQLISLTGIVGVELWAQGLSAVLFGQDLYFTI